MLSFLGGHTPLHLCADVGNHALCKALVEKGADPNAQSNEGYTPYGYVRKRLEAATGASQQLARMLQLTSEQLLKLGAYKMEKSETAIDQDTMSAKWMKGADGRLQLKTASAPKLVSYLTRLVTDTLDVDSWCWQFHRTLRDDHDPFRALAVFLQLLKGVYEQAPAGSVSATVAVHVGVWKVLDRCIDLRLELFPGPATQPATPV
jgi:hypothetical protein